jgi:glucosyl-dolichyl phosphate glucuronosyltransferase
MKASVIVPTLNRSTLLRNAVSSITQQTFSADQFEIIIVDNGSTDDTRRTLDELIGRHPRHKIRYVYEPEPGLLAARHRGAFEAAGELFVYVDDDVEPAPGWLSAIAAGFDDPKVQIVGGRNLPKYEIEPPAWIHGFWDSTPYGGGYCWYLSLMDLGQNKLRIKPTYVWGLNFSIRRHAFYDLGGFHPDILERLQRFDGDGENGLTMPAEARGLVAIYEPAAVVYHFVPASRMTPEYFERRAFSQGIRNSYSAVRRNGGPSIALWVDVKRVTGRVIRWAKQLGHAGMIARREERVILEIHKRVAAASRAGFEYHQRIIRADPYVMEWVLRPQYWDYRLPHYTADNRQFSSKNL